MSLPTTNLASANDKKDDQLNKLHARLLKAEMLGGSDQVEELKKKIQQLKEEIVAEKGLTDEEKNQIHAKILKAEMLGKHDLVKKLKEKLEEKSSTSIPSTKPEVPEVKEEVRVMEVKQRIVNEDKMSVKQLYKREKMISMLKDSRMFVASSSKAVDKNGEFDVDNEYEETAKKKSKKSEYIVSQEKQVDEDALCQNCLENFHPNYILSKGQKVFLTLGKNEPLVEGHCFIRSIKGSHSSGEIASSLVASEEETVREVDLLKQKLCLMFANERKAVIFTELWVRGRKKYDNHLVIECLPIPDDAFDEAWMYFKKGIQESESEWSTNKSVVDLKGKPLNRCLPDGLSYFWVTFGPTNEGYGHVIEDESRFPPSFAHEIIAGVIDIDPMKWKRPRKDYQYKQDTLLKIKAMFRKHDPFYEK